MIRTRQTLVVRRGADDIYRRAFHFGQTENPVEHALFVPMLRDDRLIGVLSVQRYDPVSYHADEIRTVETIAHQSAAALAHARLFAAVARARDAAQRHAADFRALLSVSRAIATAADLDAMLATLAAETRALVPHDLVAVADARMYEIRALTAPKAAPGAAREAAPQREQSSTTADARSMRG